MLKRKEYFAIAVLPQTYNENESAFILKENDNQSDTLELFDSVDDAKIRIDEKNNQRYVCNNNESGRPSYSVLSEVDADYMESGRDGDMSNYNWKKNECSCGECDICHQKMIDDDRIWIINRSLFTD